MTAPMAPNDVWENIFLSQEWGRYPAEPLIRFIARNFYKLDRPSVRILEVGCGPGANLWYLAREGFSFLGIDISQAAINQACTRLDAEVPGWRQRGSLERSDITTCDFGDQVFDAVIDNECIYCIPFAQARQIYSKLQIALKPGGKLFSRTFTTETWGYRSGVKIDEQTFLCDQGPMAGKGASRFTSEDELQSLFQGYSQLQAEKQTYTLLSGKKLVAEWIIEATR